MSTNRPPSCDLPPEFYELKLKPCPFCGAKVEQYDFDSIAVCKRKGCKVIGPDNDPHGRKWNAIPRRSEVLELLSLVDELKHASTSIQSALAFRSVINCADKLRKEMGE